jgi:hypothetical protein
LPRNLPKEVFVCAKKTNVLIRTDVYEMVMKAVGVQHVAEFLEDLALDAVPVTSPCKERWPADNELALAYRDMAADEEREKDACEWSEAFVGDVALDVNHEAR